ncbi:MAG: PqqD family protein [Rhizomicrobium sp.]
MNELVTRAVEPLETAFDDGVMLCDVKSGGTLALNVTAAAIWEAVARPATVADIRRTLQQRFEVDDATCAQAVAATLADLQKYGFVRLDRQEP